MESLTTLTHEVPHPENVVWAPPAYDEQHHLFFSHGPVLIGIVGSLIITVAMVGNVLVCLAIFTEPILSHSRSNFFIVSLAVADLLLALLVMTFALVNDLYGYWLFGETVCFIWMSADVMCETASIFSICAISYDRLKQVQKPLHYEEFMTTTRALLIIACLWICSFVVSFVPIFLEWHERSVEEIKANFKGSGSDKDRVKKKAAEAQTFSPTSNQSSGAVQKLNTKPECLFDVHFTYSVIYSFICFYIPCTIMLTNYLRLFLIARKHRHRINSIKPQVNGGVQQPRSQRTSFNRKCGVRGSKAARTLTIITGTFLACWLPFFIINPIAAIDEHLIPLEYFMVTIWLGYFNSCVNPIIYGTSNSKFRAAFKRLLGCRSVRGNVRGFSPRRSIYRAFSWIQPSRLDFTPSRRCSRTVSCSFHSDTREVDKNSDGGNSVKAEPSKSEVIITEQESSYNSS